ncbi:YcfL family protein [Vibrio sp.]|uniref:YcfL family protein n=1 Tax=Vibrio sp. TaxID=678 RepID=UPI003D0A0EBB
MKKIVVALLAVWLMSACTSHTTGLSIDGASQQVLFGDRVLASRIQIDDISTQNVYGKTRGIVRLSSQYRGDQHLQYRFYWYDADGLEVNIQPGPWTSVILRGDETRSLSEVSVNPQGKQFRVQIRELDN